MPELYVPFTAPDLFASANVGLVDVMSDSGTWITNPPKHWQGGVQYDSDCPEVNVTVSPCVSGVANPVSPSKSSTWTRGTRGSRAFTIYDEADCAPVGDWYKVGEQKVLRALAVSGPSQVERTFWSGTSGATPHVIYPNLSSTGPVLDETGRITLQPSSTIISGAPLDVTEGMGRLEDVFGQCYDSRGWVHVPIGLINALCARSLVCREGSRLYTWAGNRVVVGRGYPTGSSGSGPGGTTPPGGSAWIWATSPVWGIRGAVRTFDPVQSLDRSVDTVKFIAEQTHLLGWNCCRVGVLVTTGGEQAGDPLTPLQDT